MYRYTDKYHFKNYIRKICLDFEISKDFFENNLTQVLFNIYEFESEHKDFFLYYQFDLCQAIVNKFAQAYNKEQIIQLILSKYLNRLSDELIEISCLINSTPNYLDRNIFVNDSNSSYKINETKYSLLFELARVQNKFIGAYKGGRELSLDFMVFINDLEYKAGVYFLYNKSRELIYIGKSINLATRIIEMIRDKDGEYVSVIITETKNDMHIYKDYYILKEKPLLNSKYTGTVESVSKLKKLKRSNKICIYKDEQTIEAKNTNIIIEMLNKFTKK